MILGEFVVVMSCSEDRNDIHELQLRRAWIPACCNIDMSQIYRKYLNIVGTIGQIVFCLQVGSCT
jgi:hypothetical protein